MSKWIAWHGLEDVAPTDKNVIVLFRDGGETDIATHPTAYRWEHTYYLDDILAYKVVEENV